MALTVPSSPPGMTRGDWAGSGWLRGKWGTRYIACRAALVFGWKCGAGEGPVQSLAKDILHFSQFRLISPFKESRDIYRTKHGKRSANTPLRKIDSPGQARFLADMEAVVTEGVHYLQNYDNTQRNIRWYTNTSAAKSMRSRTTIKVDTRLFQAF